MKKIKGINRRASPAPAPFGRTAGPQGAGYLPFFACLTRLCRVNTAQLSFRWQIKHVFLYSLLFLSLIFLVLLALPKKSNIENVFDEMYYTFSPIDDHFFTLETFLHKKPVDTLFPFQQFKTTSSSGGVFYREEYLAKGESISIFPNREEKIMSILFEYKVDENNCIRIIFTYDCASKTLISEPLRVETPLSNVNGHNVSVVDKSIVVKFLSENDITESQINLWMHYVVYEKILTAWFNGNGTISNFSMENLGEYTVIDNTFAQLGENWGK